MTDCLFCKIVSGDVPATLIYEDEQVVAFNDINPQAPHHILIIPRQHIVSALDLTSDDDALIGHIHQVAVRLAEKYGFAEDGFRIVNNCNEAGGQTVWHLHFHLLGGRNMGWPPG